MGNCNFKTEKEEQGAVLNKNQFNLHYIIGRGGFGKVWKIEYKKTKETFAMKIMLKYKIYQKKSITSVLNEKSLLESLRHNFIVNIHYAFQDNENLYLIMDYLPGGDLRYHMMKNTQFTEQQTKFITACILLALEYIHNKNILHRDIKPENLVFDDKGYLRLTDFGISRIWSPKNEMDTSGTPGYMAPEVMMKLGHGIACDLFALGVIVYECMLGRRPYTGSNRKDIRDSILAKQAKITEYEKPLGWSDDAVDFTNKLLIRKQTHRLGNERPGSAKTHPWFKDFNWDALANGTMISPLKGIKMSDNDTETNKINSNEDLTDEKSVFSRNVQAQKMFHDYYFDKTKCNQIPSSDTNRLKVMSDANANSEKTTKYTTLNSISKYP